MSPRYAVVITYPLGMRSHLEHLRRTTWTRRTAEKHAADVREGRTGVRGYVTVTVEEQ